MCEINERLMRDTIKRVEMEGLKDVVLDINYNGGVFVRVQTGDDFRICVKGFLEEMLEFRAALFDADQVYNEYERASKKQAQLKELAEDIKDGAQALLESVDSGYEDSYIGILKRLVSELENTYTGAK